MRFGILSVALKNLRRKSFRTFILVLSIGLLVSIIVYGASFIISISSSIERASDRLGADLLVVPVGARDYAQEVLLETEIKSFYMDKSLVERVKKIEGIEDITHQTYLASILGLCCDISEVKIVAFNQETDFIVRPWLRKAIGRELREGEAIIGYEANENYDLLDKSRSKFFDVEFDLVGVLEKTGTGLDNAIFISDKHIAELIASGKAGVKPGQISIIFTKLKPGEDPVTVGRRVENSIIEVDVIERNDIGEDIISTLGDINRVFLITIILASLLSAFLAWAIFSAIVNERMREVGIMRALGARDGHIVKLFVVEVLMLGLLGSIVGIALGTYLSVSLSRIFTLIREMSATLTFYERAGISILGLVAGTGICLAGAVSSIMKIKKTEPLKALKEI